MELNIDLSEYQIRFNQKEYNQLSLLKNNMLKYVISFNFIGLIDLKTDLFYWANIIPGINQNFTKNNYKIKSLKNKYEDFTIKDNQINYQILSENIIHLTETVTLEYIQNFFNELLDKKILLLNNSNKKFQLISVNNILQSY